MMQAKNGAGALHLISIFFLCFFVILSSTITVATGLTLELIHRDSKRSPFYSENLTDIERYEMLNEISYERLQRFKSSSSSLEEVNQTGIRPPVKMVGSSYLVIVKIGNAPGSDNYQFLLLDTGSALTWTQCKPCKPCFAQKTDMFQPSLSPTYSRIPCNHPLCRRPDYKCEHDKCTYLVPYKDGDHVQGVLSREKFGFHAISGTQNFEYIENLPFGCSDVNHMTHVNGVSSGILGMNAKPESFAIQVAKGSFSYCLAPQARSGYLRFGNDIPRVGSPQLQQTPLEIPSGTGDYYLTLLGISVGNQRLKLDPELFRRRGDTDGVIIDSGSAKSYLVKTAYMAAEDVLKAYFNKYSLKTVKSKYGTTCFPRRSSDVERLLPSMTFHLKGANLEVPGMHMFSFLPDRTFCWNVGMDAKMTTIGSFQQIGKRFTYDLTQKILSFAPENCAMDG